MRNGKNPVTAAVRAYIDREVQKGMGRLGIASIRALNSEAHRYPATDEGGHWCDGGYEALPAPQSSRVRCVELLAAIAHDALNEFEI